MKTSLGMLNSSSVTKHVHIVDLLYAQHKGGYIHPGPSFKVLSTYGELMSR